MSTRYRNQAADRIDADRDTHVERSRGTRWRGIEGALGSDLAALDADYARRLAGLAVEPILPEYAPRRVQPRDPGLHAPPELVGPTFGSVRSALANSRAERELDRHAARQERIAAREARRLANRADRARKRNRP